MQIDGHHALTYIAARFAKFSHAKASIIAHCSQYVDDATNSGSIRFDNDAMYHRISSAHKMLDYRNFDELSNHMVWTPFHFLPGNDGKEAGADHRGSFIKKIVCYPDSYISRDMLKACIIEKDKPYNLHRLGISMHVYADTWAHQGFAGVTNRVNEVSNIVSNVKSLDKSWWGKIKTYFVSETFPLGHGAALSHPDRPYLVWSYENCFGKVIKRDNPSDFLEATDYMCRAMQCYQNNDLSMDLDNAEGLPENDKKVVARLIKSIKEKTSELRHEKWLAQIAKGVFSFGAVDISYKPKGKGSWKHKAIGQIAAADTGREIFKYKDSFLTSHWKYFHDALQAHRFDVIHNILPRYGICVS
ncbi:hypothetical protein MNBD_GAMMA12-3986 [hydrothermal vent metagenome]|uniref:Uncharacterized protein n=1 Tax=hydrothermal vent metagenome TaxID=652676 RepID=A0A3B0YRG3_9ZZZZ